MDDSDIKKAAYLDSGMIALSGGLYSCTACDSAGASSILSIDHNDGCPLKEAVDQAFGNLPDGAALGVSELSESTKLDILSKVSVDEIAQIDFLVGALGAAPPEDVSRAQIADRIYEMLPTVDRQLVASVATSGSLSRQALDNFRFYLLFELGMSRDLPQLRSMLQGISSAGTTFDSIIDAARAQR